MATGKTKAAPKTEPAGPKDKGLRVMASTDSYWRGDHEFSREPREIALADLTPEQVEAIQDDPRLVVVEIDLPAA